MVKGNSHRYLPFELDETSRVPIQKQLIEKFKEAIVTLYLMPGQLLPSSRELAVMLNISRATAVRVYKDLTAQGYIETIEGSGTFVRKRLAPLSVLEENGPSAFQLSGFANHLMQLKPEKLTAHDFPELNYGCSPPSLLPLSQWKQALLDSARHLQSSEIEYGQEPFGYRPLRKAICKFLSSSRMIDTSVENLVVCSSSTYLLNLIAEVLVNPGDVIAFPEPGSTYARDTFNSLGAELVPVQVDENGLVVADLAKMDPVPKLVYVNSSHHDPTGACLSLERRKALVAWASQNSTILIEDDYDADYRYAGSPIPPLRALSKNVVYISNFWRTLYPLVSVNFAVLPEPLVTVLTQAWQLIQHAFHTHFPFIDQQAVTEFLNEGDYEKHVQRNHGIFAARWRACVHALTRNFGRNLEIAPESSTYHVFFRLISERAEHDILKAAKEAGLSLLSSSGNFMSNAPSNCFVLPFAYIEEADLADRIDQFKKIVQI